MVQCRENTSTVLNWPFQVGKQCRENTSTVLNWPFQVRKQYYKDCNTSLKKRAPFLVLPTNVDAHNIIENRKPGQTLLVYGEACGLGATLLIYQKALTLLDSNENVIFIQGGENWIDLPDLEKWLAKNTPAHFVLDMLQFFTLKSTLPRLRNDLTLMQQYCAETGTNIFISSSDYDTYIKSIRESLKQCPVEAMILRPSQTDQLLLLKHFKTFYQWKISDEELGLIANINWYNIREMEGFCKRVHAIREYEESVVGPSPEKHDEIIDLLKKHPPTKF